MNVSCFWCKLIFARSAWFVAHILEEDPLPLQFPFHDVQQFIKPVATYKSSTLIWENLDIIITC